MAEEIKNQEQIGNCNFIHDFIDEDIAPGGEYYGKAVHPFSAGAKRIFTHWPRKGSLH